MLPQSQKIILNPKKPKQKKQNNPLKNHEIIPLPYKSLITKIPSFLLYKELN